jgi:hypothetical protein
VATKNNPGKYDCYANADPDEPLFVLLARDRHAPALVWLWTVLRELDREEPEKLKEAQECCLAMMQWARGRGRQSVGLGQAALAGVLELARAANFAVKEARAANNVPTTIDAVRAFFAETRLEE